jgi:hypothetical protein
MFLTFLSGFRVTGCFLIVRDIESAATQLIFERFLMKVQDCVTSQWQFIVSELDGAIASYKSRIQTGCDSQSRKELRALMSVCRAARLNASSTLLFARLHMVPALHSTKEQAFAEFLKHCEQSAAEAFRENPQLTTQLAVRMWSQWV